MNLKETKAFLQEHKMRPRKSLGQNFLIRSALAEKIAGEALRLPGPYVEIGPGAGALTRLFPQKRKAELSLIEKDRRLALYWESQGFAVRHEDALKTDYTAFPAPMVLLGNLPYQISGPLILKLSEKRGLFRALIFMFQKEVAERIQAQPKTKACGLLSIMAQAFWSIQRTGAAGPEDFYPRPQVESSVLKLTPKRGRGAPSAKRFLRFLKPLFQNRRKKLSRKLPCASFEEAEKALSSLGHSSMARAEELSAEDFVQLFHKWKEEGGGRASPALLTDKDASRRA